MLKRELKGLHTLSKLTYSKLLHLIAAIDGFDPIYSMKHLTVYECFYYIEGKDWNDLVDEETIEKIRIEYPTLNLGVGANIEYIKESLTAEL